MKDVYEQFAYDYDEFGSITDFHGDEKTFFENLFEKNNIKTVLDCACGTGQHLCMFTEMGYEVSGSDYSESMLDVARKNLRNHNISIPLCQCDFRFLEQKHKNTFDAIVCLSTALPHLHTDEDLILALKSMKQKLNKGGILILTQGTTLYTLSLPPIEVVINREGFSRIFVKEHDGEFQAIHVLDLFHSKNRIENNQYDIVYRILFDNDYRRLLSKAGFEEIHIYGDYNMGAYNENSRRLIVVAKCT